MRELLQYHIRLEFRKKSIFLSLLLYLISLVFINYLAVGTTALPGPTIWSALFWMALLSTLTHAIAKSFLNDRPGQIIYFYNLVSPTQIIFSKIIYGFFLCVGISLVGYLFFSLWLTNPIQNTSVFLLTLILSSFGFSASLSILSAIASKTINGSMVMAILSFPIMISILLMSIKITKNCIDGLGWDASIDELLTLTAINILATAFSYLLFPYIWRS